MAKNKKTLSIVKYVLVAVVFLVIGYFLSSLINSSNLSVPLNNPTDLQILNTFCAAHGGTLGYVGVSTCIGDTSKIPVMGIYCNVPNTAGYVESFYNSKGVNICIQ